MTIQIHELETAEPHASHQIPFRGKIRIPVSTLMILHSEARKNVLDARHKDPKRPVVSEGQHIEAGIMAYAHTHDGIDDGE